MTPLWGIMWNGTIRHCCGGWCKRGLEDTTARGRGDVKGGRGHHCGGVMWRGPEDTTVEEVEWNRAEDITIKVFVKGAQRTPLWGGWCERDPEDTTVGSMMWKGARGHHCGGHDVKGAWRTPLWGGWLETGPEDTPVGWGDVKGTEDTTMNGETVKWSGGLWHKGEADMRGDWEH